MSKRKSGSSRIVMVTWLIGVLAATEACSPAPEGHAQLDDMAFRRGAPNVALLIGEPNGLTGIDLDLNMMDETLNRETGGSFEVRRIWREDAQAVVEATRQAALDVGDEGTLFWFFSGHGSTDGQLITEPGAVDFDDVAAAIKASRAKPLKRLMLFVDACFSGNLVDGRNEVARGETEGATFSLVENGAESLAELATRSLSPKAGRYSATLADQLLVVAAADAQTESLAGNDGSTFTKGVWQAFHAAREDSETTIASFLDQVSRNTLANSGGQHFPVYKAFPGATLLNERLSSEESAAPPVFLFMAEEDAGGSTPLFLSCEKDRSVTAVCVGAAADSCSPATGVAIHELAARAGRRYFATNSGLRAQAGETLTVVTAEQATGSQTAVQSFVVQPMNGP